MIGQSVESIRRRGGWRLKASQDFIRQLENLYEEYEREVNDNARRGMLTDSTAKTYLVHSTNFIRWCRSEFVPGKRNDS